MGNRLFMVAGEASADMHAAALLKEIKKLNPNIECSGVGGPALRKAGVNVLLDSEQLNVVGISDWLDRFKEVLGGYRKVVNYLKKDPPDFAILLDLPDFNLRLAKHLKLLGVPVFYYISPQVWAWRKYRINQIKRDVDLMLVVFPFEKDFYLKEGLKVEFVGHPLLDLIQPKQHQRTQSEILDAPRVAILPGSRRSEVRFHGALIQELTGEIFTKYPKAEIKIPVAETLSEDFVKQNIQDSRIQFQIGNSHELLKWADVAFVASGTATLETALIGTPFMLFYKVSPTSAWIYKKLMKYKGFIGMPNLLHKREVVREFFQEEAVTPLLFKEFDNLIQNEGYRTTQAKILSDCRNLLGEGGASTRAAENIITFIKKKKNFQTEQKR